MTGRQTSVGIAEFILSRSFDVAQDDRQAKGINR